MHVYKRMAALLFLEAVIYPNCATFAHSAQRPFVGRWATNSDKCRINQDIEVFTNNGSPGYEGNCKFVKLIRSGNRWNITEKCTGEGGPLLGKLEIVLNGDKMQMNITSPFRSSLNLIRCP